MPLPDDARDDRTAWLALSLTPGLGPVSIAALLARFGPPSAVLEAPPTALAGVIGAAAAERLHADDPARRAAVHEALAWAEDPECHLVALGDPAYPSLLYEIPDPPPLLYVRGDPALLREPAIAIVGSRHGTRTGVRDATAFAHDLAGHGWVIVSGLALGIDTAAHEGALRGGRTVAVMGTGLDRVYPAANRALARRIVAGGGALVAELALGTPARRDTFPRRNRLIAGLARGVLVVEAARHSGSLITARLAADAGREVFAIPGSIHSPLSRGCHWLIRQGAKLVESSADIVAELPAPAAAPAGQAPVLAAQGAAPPPGAGRHRRAAGGPAATDSPGWSEAAGAVLAALAGGSPESVDQLASNAPFGAATVQAALLELELAGRVERLPDGRFRRLPDEPAGAGLLACPDPAHL